jgi:hypothetical protein
MRVDACADDILEVEGKTEHDREYDREGFHVA